MSPRRLSRSLLSQRRSGSDPGYPLLCSRYRSTNQVHRSSYSAQTRQDRSSSRLPPAELQHLLISSKHYSRSLLLHQSCCRLYPEAAEFFLGYPDNNRHRLNKNPSAGDLHLSDNLHDIAVQNLLQIIYKII